MEYLNFIFIFIFIFPNNNFVDVVLLQLVEHGYGI